MPNGQPKYDESFKKSVVSLYQNGKSQIQISKEYGISSSAINRWGKQYSEIKLDDGVAANCALFAFGLKSAPRKGRPKNYAASSLLFRQKPAGF